jgi:glutamate synthase (ferredoxin)
MNEGRIIEDDEIKMHRNKTIQKMAKWQLTTLAKIPYTNNTTPTENLDYETRLRDYLVILLKI